jgi:hypothetical protein
MMEAVEAVEAVENEERQQSRGFPADLKKTKWGRSSVG